jgi:spermidine/putrescine transport system substrate-binding protein
MKRTWYFAVLMFCVILLACQPVGNPGGGGGGGGGVVNGDAETTGDNGDTGDAGDPGDVGGAGDPGDVGGGGGEAGGGSVSARCGDTSQLAGEIFMYNWTEYIDPDIIDQFEEECGVRVVETNYDSNETLLASLQAGGGGYDIIVPSDYMVQIMVDEGMLMEIDFNVVTNIANMDPLNVNQYFDPDQKYTVPYFWGTSGFALDTNAVTEYEESWEMVFDTESPYCGEISMLDDQRETLGAALMYLGYSINDTDPAHLEEAKNLLIDQSACVLAYDSETNDDLIISGETVMSHIWTGDAILAGDPEYGGRDGIVYVIPEEGCTIWQDNLAIPVDSANAYTAMVFINYLQYPEIAAQNAEWVGYATPNEAAKEFIDPEILADESVYPTAEVSARLQWIEDVGDALQLYDRIWTEFKAAIGSGG